MEPRVKPGFNGVSGASDSRRGYMGAAVAVSRKPPVNSCAVALRVFILAATLVAAVLMGVDRQTSVVQVTIADTLPQLQVPVTAKWSYSTAFVTETKQNMNRSINRLCVRLLATARDGGNCAWCTKMVEIEKYLVFSLVYKLIDLALLLPVSTTSVEREFSATKIIKSKLRNKMSNIWFNNLRICYTERETFKNLHDDAIVRRFQVINDRKGQSPTPN